MDMRDKHLNRHMRQRQVLAARLPPERQRQWAGRCMALAAAQHRTAYYLMSALWFAGVNGQYR